MMRIKTGIILSYDIILDIQTNNLLYFAKLYN